MDVRTRQHAKVFDRVRRESGPTGSLVLLEFVDDHDYRAKLVIESGWFAYYPARHERQDAQPADFIIEIADVHEGLGALLKGASRAPRAAVEGTVYVFEENRVYRPTLSPRVWRLEAFVTDDRFTLPDDE